MITFNPLEGNYRVNDSITLKGKATGFAGNDIGDALVKYRVIRTAHFPIWNSRFSVPFPISPETEITNGVTRSLPNGDFMITFKAIPDRTIPKSNAPVFDYLVTTDVTDMNGETHSAQKYVMVGYKALNLSVNVPSTVEKSEKAEFGLYTTNFNGDKQPATGNWPRATSNQHSSSRRSFAAPRSVRQPLLEFCIPDGAPSAPTEFGCRESRLSVGTQAAPGGWVCRIQEAPPL